MARLMTTEVEDRTPALLVYSQEHPLEEIRQMLHAQGVDTSRVRECGQAAALLNSKTPPVLVFTAIDLPDGSWEDILEAASTACFPVPVIVVSNQDEARLSLRAWEQGAAGYLAPPFKDEDLGRAVRSAMLSGFLASTSTRVSMEGLVSNAENHMGSQSVAAHA